MTKTEKAKYNQLVKQVEKLEKDFKSMEENKNMYYKERNQLQKEIDSVHAALDSLPGLPDKYFKTDSYGSRTELTITARLFSWIATMAFENKIKTKVLED